MRRIGNFEAGQRNKPIVAIVLSGQIGRVVVQSKLDRLFTDSNHAEFDIVVVAALSASPNRYRKAFQFSAAHGLGQARHWQPIFNGTVGDLYAIFAGRTNADLIFYSFSQSEVAEQGLPVFNNQVALSRAQQKFNSTLSHLSQFDGLRRAMALVLAYEDIIGAKVDYVLRARDDEHFLDDIHFSHSVTALGDQYDFLSNECGNFGGLNDHTYFFKRNSPAFEAVRRGQLKHSYLAKKPPAWAMQNPEYLLFSAMATHGARIALVPPCHFSSVTLRKTTVGFCIHAMTWYANIYDGNIELNKCGRFRNRVMEKPLQTCQTERNPLGRVQTQTSLPRCADPWSTSLISNSHDSKVSASGNAGGPKVVARVATATARPRPPKPDTKPQYHWQ